MERYLNGSRKFWACVAMAVLIGGWPVDARSETKWEIWNTDSAEVRVKGPWYAGVEQEFHWGNEARKLSYEHTDVYCIYKSAAWLHMAAGFQYVGQTNDASWEKEARPHIDGTLLAQWRGFKVSDRNRFEYRILSHTKDFVRYRNKMRFEVPWAWTRFKLSPVAEYEGFVDFDQAINNYYRISGGLVGVLGKYLTAELFVLRQDGFDRNFPEDLHVAGIKLNLAF